MKDLSQVEILEIIQDYARRDVDPLVAWREFRARYDQKIIQGNNGNEREEVFRTRLERAKTHPAAMTMDIRKARVQAWMVDFVDAMLRCDVPEVEVERWGEIIQRTTNSPVTAVPSGLQELATKAPVEAGMLTARAKELWPNLTWEVTSE